MFDLTRFSSDNNRFSSYKTVPGLQQTSVSELQEQLIVTVRMLHWFFLNPHFNYQSDNLDCKHLLKAVVNARNHIKIAKRGKKRSNVIGLQFRSTYNEQIVRAPSFLIINNYF